MPTTSPAPVYDPLPLIALIVSVFAALVGMIAIIWNIIAWVRSGHQVSVQIQTVVHNPNQDATWTGKRGRLGWRASTIPPSLVKHSIVFVSIIARNQGRSAVDIERFYCTVGRQSQNKNISWKMSDDPPLPQRLEPGASASRRYLLTEVEAFVKRENRRHFRGAVSLGDGTVRQSRRSFNIVKRKRGEAFLASSMGHTMQAPSQNNTLL